MKTTLKFITLLLMAMAMTITSCSKDEIEGPIGPQGTQGAQGIQGPDGAEGPAGQDGEALGVPGPQGPAGAAGADGTNGANGTNGIDGTDGTNGTNGTNGTDGNANVVASSWTNLNFPGSWNVNNEARFTISDANITLEVINSYALLSYVKFTGANSASSVPFMSVGSTYEIHDSMSVGAYVAFAIVNDIATQPTPPMNHQVRYVLVAPSNISGKSDAPSLEKMKMDGVDTTNYRAVMDYLGLDY